MKEKKINICGKEVGIAYCMAAEQGFEEISGKSFADFDPKMQRDLLALLSACMVAYAQAHDEEAKVTGKDILFNATPTEIADALSALARLRVEWYDVPVTVEQPEGGKEEENPKNA